MTDHDPGDEPAEPNDEKFAPVLRGADARGRTTDEEHPSTGTGVPGKRTRHPAALPPDTTGVREAERRDATRPQRGNRRGSSPRAH